MVLNMEKEFWNKRWADGNTGWDMGAVSPPLKAYVDQLNDKTIHILIPGCGNAYEAEYLWSKGFKNTFIVEISKGAIDSFKARFGDFPAAQIFHGDFFDLSLTDEQIPENGFDLILEQTFFCAIHPSKRANYATQMRQLLKPGGKLVGLLFDFPLETGPPFGGSRPEYKSYFEPYFKIEKMERAHNSIKPRQGRELFISLTNQQKAN